MEADARRGVRERVDSQYLVATLVITLSCMVAIGIQTMELRF